MSSVLLVQVDPQASERLRQVGEHHPELDFIDVSTPTLDPKQLEQLDTSIEALVIGSFVPEPLQLAQKAQAVEKNLSVLVLSDEGHYEQMRQALRFSPSLGRGVRCVPSNEGEELAGALEEAITATRRRRQYTAAMAASQARLDAHSDFSPQASYLEQLLRYAPVGIVAVDSRGTVLAWNRGAAAILGVEERQALGSSFLDFYEEPARGQLALSLRRCSEEENRCPPIVVDFGAKHLELTMAHLSTRDRRGGAIVIIQDVTEQVRAETDARRFSEQAAKATLLARRAEQAHRSSEQQLHLITDAVPALIGYIDLERRYRFNNRTYEDWFGVSREQAHGKHVWEVLGAENYASLRGYMDRASQGEAVRFEVVLSLERLGPRFISGSYIPDRDENGTVRGFCVLMHDITDRTRTEEALRHSEARKSAIVDAALDCVITIDAGGKITEFNPAAEQTFGIKRQDALGRDMAELIIPPHLREAHRRGMECLLQTGEGPILNRRIEVPAMRADGTVFPAELAVTVMPSEGGSPVYTAFLRDITERHKALQEIARANAAMAEARDRALEASRAKSLFLANMSHELRTPLNAIIGYAEMLQDEARDIRAEQICPDLERIRTAGRHLLAIINDILDLSKIEAGKMDVLLETFSVADAVDEALQQVQPVADRNGNELVVSVSDDTGRIHSDRLKVVQILVNLLGNACKFTNNGRVELRAIREEGKLPGAVILFEVVDTGIGITPEQMEKLFVEFTQADPTSTRKYGGTGLGLAICKRYCEMLGGSISAESAVGKGSRFSARIPVDSAPFENEQDEL